jgi:DNA polymerase-3 subunit alpha
MSTVPFKNIMIFDTETTGLIPKSKDYPTPYITQLSFIIYDTEKEMIRSTFDSYIRIPYSIEIPEIVTEITGITKKKCEKGIPIEIAIGIFYHAMTLCDCIIGHNIDFDIQMINIEIQRNIDKLYFLPNIENIFSQKRLETLCINLDCTMKLTTDLCSIYRITEKNYKYKKYPKLSETYFHLFQKVPENLHNSMIDALVCLRCYLKFKFNIIIEDGKFEELIKKNNNNNNT